MYQNPKITMSFPKKDAFAILYASRTRTIAEMSEISMEEAERIRDKFFKNFPYDFFIQR